LKRMKNIPSFDRPREKLAAKGPEALSDTELLAILLGSGVKGRDVFRVAHDILKKLDNDDEKMSVNDLGSIDGVGFAKSCQIVASFELARRRLLKEHLLNLPEGDY